MSVVSISLRFCLCLPTDTVESLWQAHKQIKYARQVLYDFISNQLALDGEYVLYCDWWRFQCAPITNTNASIVMVRLVRLVDVR